MLLEPTAIVLYVDDLAKASQFYQDLLGMKPEEASATFHAFKLSNGINLGLKANFSAEPPADKTNGNGELAFTVDSPEKVDGVFAEWQGREIKILLPPTIVPYGYTFVALDPDNNRLRVVALRSD
jgi:catechol 2,3-dioxygenase-like lactoylglutathione lyase family enzyme